MPKFPVDAPKAKVVKALELQGFAMVRQREHISMVRENDDGTNTPLTMPNHPRIKGSRYERSAHSLVSRGATSYKHTSVHESAHAHILH